MQTSKNPFQMMIAKLLYITGDVCPECSSDMYAWRQKNKDGTERCGPTCMGCGYRMLKKKEEKTNLEMSRDSFKAKTIKLLKHGSLLTDKPLIDKRLSDYKIVDDETKRAKERSTLIINKVLLGEPIHGVFLGKTGVGKSHLSMGICWEIIERSDYRKKCLYVSFPYLLDQLKFAFNDEQARKAITGELMSEIQKADFVVIDDLGAELGVFNSKSISSVYSNDTLTKITDARQNKAVIYTTNLNKDQLVQAYGDRVFSRMANNSNGYGFTFKTTQDKRIAGI